MSKKGQDLEEVGYEITCEKTLLLFKNVKKLVDKINKSLSAENVYCIINGHALLIPNKDGLKNLETVEAKTLRKKYGFNNKDMQIKKLPKNHELLIKISEAKAKYNEALEAIGFKNENAYVSEKEGKICLYLEMYWYKNAPYILVPQGYGIKLNTKRVKRSEAKFEEKKFKHLI